MRSCRAASLQRRGAREHFRFQTRKAMKVLVCGGRNFRRPGASLPCARPAAPREAHNGIDAGWSDGSRPYPGCTVGLEDELGIEPGRGARVLAHCPEGLTQWKKGQTKQRYDTDQGLTLCRKLQRKINEPLNPTPSASMMFVQPGDIGNRTYLRHG